MVRLAAAVTSNTAKAKQLAGRGNRSKKWRVEFGDVIVGFTGGAPLKD